MLRQTTKKGLCNELHRYIYTCTFSRSRWQLLRHVDHTSERRIVSYEIVDLCNTNDCNLQNSKTTDQFHMQKKKKTRL